ncbi:MAG: sphingomyelin phosphodiesterase 3-like [Gammaproteobacteria bacterium]|jgi:endonuclease/exonuclease/phosphatase family metal-dependent hydrolase|nr:sphingomyelin phosphodiesterase 3-like [Gammaproteobacteria bacterium]
MPKIYYPSAAYYYSDTYSVDISQDQLNSIGTPVFTTHRDPIAEKSHHFSQFCLIPWRKSAQLLGSAFQSQPGANKDNSIVRARPFRILVGVVGILSLSVSAVIALVTLPVHLAAWAGYKSRPVISYMNVNKDKQASPLSQIDEEKSALLVAEMTAEKPLHVRTHNLGFVLETMSIVNDLRPVSDRANEIAAAILGDEYPPDVICFQEAFHEDGSRILCNKLKDKYPYIVSGVLPTATGFNSGEMVVSKYPIANIHFQRLQHMLGPERLTPRGILRVQINTKQGPLDIYNVHTQALLGKDRAKAREKQLEQIKKIMKEDFEQRGHLQILMGDLNTSTLTAWGESNGTHDNPEQGVQQQLLEGFEDIYLRDHISLQGYRTIDTPKFLKSDNNKMGVGDLPEPTGSWYIGPYAASTTLINSQMLAYKERDQKKHDYTFASGVKVENPVSWGTKAWRKKQPANTARFDYILFPRYKDKDGQSISSQLDGRAEIRRIVVSSNAQSAPSDHLPVDAQIWRKKDSGK